MNIKELEAVALAETKELIAIVRRSKVNGWLIPILTLITCIGVASLAIYFIG